LKRLLGTPPGTALRVTLTVLAFGLTLVVFREARVADAALMLRRMFALHPGADLPLPPAGVWVTVAVVALGHALAASGLWKRLATRLPDAVMGCGYATVLTLALILAPPAGKTFIYFQF